MDSQDSFFSLTKLAERCGAFACVVWCGGGWEQGSERLKARRSLVLRSDEAHNTTTQANRLKIDKKSKGGSPFLYLDTITNNIDLQKKSFKPHKQGA